MNEVQEFCKHHNLTEDKFYGRVKIEGYLDLDSLTSIPDGFNPTVGGYLYLSSLTSIPDGFNPTVGGYLYLNSLTSIPVGFNPTVGYSLDLSSLTSIPVGFNPTVGGSLDLNSLTSIPEGFNPTVGYSLYLPGNLKGEKRDLPSNYLFSWQDGKYIKADGLFAEVVRKHGNVWELRQIGKTESTFLVSDGEAYAHGSTVDEARESLLFKIKDRNMDAYAGLTTESVLPFYEMVKCYRVITGACEFGVRDFIKRKMPEHKDEYSIGEILKATVDEYGHETFKVFFNK